MKFDYQHQPGLELFNRDLKINETPLVTIVTPYYNGKEYFEQTYNCVMNQSFPWFEWIIVNDGSTQKEDVEFAEKLATKDPRVKIVHKENGGISSARNYGMRMAQTEYVMPLDCDDLIEPTYLEYCWWMMEKNPEAAWAYTDCVGFQDQEYTWKEPFDPIRLKKENHLTAVALIRKKIWQEVGEYEEASKHYNEDWYLWLKMVASGYFPVQSKNDFLFWHRRRDGGVLSIVEKQSKEIEINRKLISEIADKVISPKQPIIYPRQEYNFEEPQLSDWNRTIYKQHKKIHITLLTAWLELGGADKFNLDLLAGLDKEQFEVSILTTVPNREEPWQQKFRSVTPDVFNLPNFMMPRDYAEFISYFLKSRETDILLVTNSYHGYYLMPWLRCNFPDLALVDYVHGEEWYWRNGGYARTSGLVKGVTEKTYVCNSVTKKVLEESFDREPENVETVHIGVDDAHFNPDYISTDYMLDKYGIDKNRPIVLFICRFYPEKRPLMMVEIAKKVKEEIPDVAFLAVGDGVLYDDMQKRVEKYDLDDTIYFTGSQDEVRPFYKAAILTLICSFKEGLALTAYESCSMGTPVISADVGGQRDLIDSEVGALIKCRHLNGEHMDVKTFDKNEIQEYADVIVEFLTDDIKLENASKNCRRRIEEEFSIKKMAEHFSTEFEYLCSNEELKKKRRIVSEKLKLFTTLFADYFAIELKEQSLEDGHDEAVEKDKYCYEDRDGIEKRITVVETALQNYQKVLNRHEEMAVCHEAEINHQEEVINHQEAMIECHEEVVNRHEEVINRHEEVVNRHEQSINHQWNVQKWHEERLQEVEKSFIGKLVSRIRKK